MTSRKLCHLVTAIATIGTTVVGDAVAQGGQDWTRLERPRTNAPKPTTTAITIDDLRTRVFGFADDSMRGRVLADIGNVKGTQYIASELKRIGVEPAGENGGYFQLVPIVERSFDENSRVRIGDQALEAWKDYLVRDQGSGARTIDGVPTIFGGFWGDQSRMISRDAAAGKVVVLAVRPGEAGGGNPGLPLRPQVAAYFDKANAVLVVAMEAIPAGSINVYKQPSGGMRVENPPPVAAYIYVTNNVARAVFGAEPSGLTAGVAGRTFTGNPTWAEKLVEHAAYNVVGIVRGSDPVLSKEYVAIGSHNDHVGLDPEPAAHDSMYVLNHLFKEQGADSPEPRLGAADFAKVNAILADIRRKTSGASARLDSVYNGADDDASGSMALLEMAEFVAGQRVKPKRSMLFVWHVGEEAGLFGSEWFTDHPTVPRESIVAQLNIDMVGRGDATDVTGSTKDNKSIRGGDNYLQLIGSRRLSTELGDLVEKVNVSKAHKMALDYSLDADAHPQNIYCRSDHYSYARYGIPVVFFTTGGHADYHQLSDEPQYLNYPHLMRVANFIRDVAMDVANVSKRPVVDKPKPDPKGNCQQ
ncbi:MAG: M28 family peptidase [Gemmatimonadota bacterium]|nr:M28 family peptidase [Gemmatimonadota bacterium]